MDIEIKKFMKIMEDNESDSGQKLLIEDGEGSASFHLSSDIPGQFGTVLTIDDDSDLNQALANILNIHDGWQLTKVGNGWAAYEANDRLTFFSDKNDFQEDDE